MKKQSLNKLALHKATVSSLKKVLGGLSAMSEDSSQCTTKDDRCPPPNN